MSPQPSALGRYAAISQVAFEFVVPAALGFALDSWMAWGPWATITGAVLGPVGGFVHLIHLMNKANAADDAERAPPTEHPPNRPTDEPS